MWCALLNSGYICDGFHKLHYQVSKQNNLVEYSGLIMFTVQYTSNDLNSKKSANKFINLNFTEVL